MTTMKLVGDVRRLADEVISLEERIANLEEKLRGHNSTPVASIRKPAKKAKG